MFIRRTVVLSFMAISLMFLNGCAAVILGAAGAGVGAGAGTIAYIKGELKATEEVTLNNAWNAALATMKELEFVIIKDEKDSFEGNIEAYRVTNKKVKIKLLRKTENITEIKIRVGTFGDETLSRVILGKMKSRF